MLEELLKGKCIFVVPEKNTPLPVMFQVSVLETFFVSMGNKCSRNYRRGVTFKNGSFCMYYYYMKHLMVIVQFLKGEK